MRTYIVVKFRLERFPLIHQVAVVFEPPVLDSVDAQCPQPLEPDLWKSYVFPQECKLGIRFLPLPQCFLIIRIMTFDLSGNSPQERISDLVFLFLVSIGTA